MALATETDPVQTVKDILDATDDADYTGTKPPVIQKMAENDFNYKFNKPDDAIYIHRPADGDMQQSSAGESYNETQIVQIEVWTSTDENKAWEIIKDLRDHIWSTYGFDNGAATNWHRIQPVSGIDFRDETKQGRNRKWVAAIQVRLTDLREI